MLEQKQQHQISHKYKKNRWTTFASQEKGPVNYALTYNVLPTTPSGQISGEPNRSICHCIFKINALTVSIMFGLTTPKYRIIMFYFIFALCIVPLQFDHPRSLVKRHSIWLGLAPTLSLYFIYKHYLDGSYSCNSLQLNLHKLFLNHFALETSADQAG